MISFTKRHASEQTRAIANLTTPKVALVWFNKLVEQQRFCPLEHIGRKQVTSC